MIIAIEYPHHPTYGPITELHCPNRHLPTVGEAIRILTGEHPVPVPLCGCTSVYFVQGLNMEEACALLRMFLYGLCTVGEIDWPLIWAEVALEGQDRLHPELLNNEAVNEEVCANCRRLSTKQGDNRC